MGAPFFYPVKGADNHHRHHYWRTPHGACALTRSVSDIRFYKRLQRLRQALSFTTPSFQQTHYKGNFTHHFGYYSGFELSVQRDEPRGHKG
jgi:hypothetical protein